MKSLHVVKLTDVIGAIDVNDVWSNIMRRNIYMDNVVINAIARSVKNDGKNLSLGASISFSLRHGIFNRI